MLNKMWLQQLIYWTNYNQFFCVLIVFLVNEFSIYNFSFVIYHLYLLFFFFIITYLIRNFLLILIFFFTTKFACGNHWTGKEILLLPSNQFHHCNNSLWKKDNFMTFLSFKNFFFVCFVCITIITISFIIFKL